MSGLSSFDYQRSVPTLEEALHACRVPKALQGACRALCGACIFAACVWIFEGVRLDRAVQLENVNANRYARQLSALKIERVYEKRVLILADLDRRVRTIAESGTLAARRLANISADLPGDVWITAVTPDAGGITLDGRTGDLKALSAALVRLNADPLFEKPSLVSAQVTTGARALLSLRFTLHLAAMVP